MNWLDIAIESSGIHGYPQALRITNNVEPLNLISNDTMILQSHFSIISHDFD